MRGDITGILDGAHLNIELFNFLSRSPPLFSCSLVLIECLIMQIAHHLWMGHDEADRRPLFSPILIRAP